MEEILKAQPESKNKDQNEKKKKNIKQYLIIIKKNPF